MNLDMIVDTDPKYTITTRYKIVHITEDGLIKTPHLLGNPIFEKCYTEEEALIEIKEYVESSMRLKYNNLTIMLDVKIREIEDL